MSAPVEVTSALLQSWLGSSVGGIQLTVYSLILMAVILWRPLIHPLVLFFAGGVLFGLAEVLGLW